MFLLHSLCPGRRPTGGYAVGGGGSLHGGGAGPDGGQGSRQVVPPPGCGRRVERSGQPDTLTTSDLIQRAAGDAWRYEHG